MEYSSAYKARLTQQTDIRQIKYQGEILRCAQNDRERTQNDRERAQNDRERAQNDSAERFRETGEVNYWTFQAPCGK
jgi:hypothetical protein